MENFDKDSLTDEWIDDDLPENDESLDIECDNPQNPCEAIDLEEQLDFELWEIENEGGDN